MLITYLIQQEISKELVGISLLHPRKEHLSMAKKNKQKKQKQIIKRTYKDSLFRMLFKDPKHLLELYNAINGTHYEDPGALEINTLENAVYLSIKNDISVIVDTTLSLYEHQSTYSPNLPYRNLQYVSAIYAGIVSENQIYSSRALQLPTPSFVVFYNGPDKHLPDRTQLRLSDLFKKNNVNPEAGPWMELTTIILNINKGHNEQLMKTCQILGEYTELVSRIRCYQKDMSLEGAVACAIDECISEGILAEFLNKNRREAIRVSVLECKVEDVMKTLQEEAKEDGFAEGHAEGFTVGHAEGRAEGRAEGLVAGEASGKTKNQLASINALIKNLNMHPLQAMDALNIPEEERNSLMKQLNI